VTKRALIVGFGSIGRRHAEVLDGLGFVSDVVSRRAEGDGGPVFATIGEALAQHSYEYAVVADETARHGHSIAALVAAGHRGTVLVEKPLFAARQSVPSHDFQHAAVAYNLRFHPAVRALRETLGGEMPQVAHFYVGQWLDDWRAGRAGTSSYSGHRAAGGGALRDLSHELDLVGWLFGDWREVAALGGRFGTVTADADDAWGILLVCERCPLVVLHLNCLDRVPQRAITVQAGGRTIHADLVAGSVRVDGETQTFSVERNATYRDMHRAVLTRSEEACSLAQGLRTVDLIATIEQASAGRRWIGRAA
jgi:predicted dehydrogenase